MQEKSIEVFDKTSLFTQTDAKSHCQARIPVEQHEVDQTKYFAIIGIPCHTPSARYSIVFQMSFLYHQSCDNEREAIL
jgi:hypothetical protein